MKNTYQLEMNKIENKLAVGSAKLLSKVAKAVNDLQNRKLSTKDKQNLLGEIKEGLKAYQEMEILKLHFKGVPNKEIAIDFDLSDGRISQLLKKTKAEWLK